MNMATGEPRPSFDQILAQSQSRSRSDSANSASLITSLPPPPRRRKPSTPESLTTASVTVLPMQRHQIPTLDAQFPQEAASNPFRNPPSLTDTDSLRRPNPFTLYDGGHRYADSLSSLNSYSNLFYKPGDEARETPVPRIRTSDDQSSDHASLDDTSSREDYSDLLYPELQVGNAPPRSPQPSIDVHGPPMRKRTPSFASHESRDGPESPVEFANIGILSLPTPVPAPQEHQPSKVDRLLGLDPKPSSRRGSVERLIPQSGRRDSFMEFDIAASRQATDRQLRNQPSASDEMPIFALRHAGSILPNTSLNGYKALVDVVDHKEATDGSPKLDSRQILVDGSDRQKPIRSPPPNPEGNRSSAASPPLEPRLSTSNFLDQQERADAVRKNRKIAQVLGPDALPSAQAFSRPGRTTPTQDAPDFHRDPTYRSTRPYSTAFDGPRADATSRAQKKAGANHRPPHLHTKSSWSALEHETVYLSHNGRRHSSPMNPTFDPSITRQVDSDVASMSSLGSIITPERPVGGKKAPRSGSPSSFMEMSDDEGGTTPKRRLSVESPLSAVHNPKHTGRTGRTASLNDILTVSSALESPRRVSVPNTPPVEDSASWSRSRDDETCIRGQRDSWDEYGFGDVENEDMRLERQRKREKLAKIHRYLGSKVPAELVLGYSSSTDPSSPVARPVSQLERSVSDDHQEVKQRRRSSSAVLYQQVPKADTIKHKESESRVRDTLTDAERLMKIKRAQKLEQVCASVCTSA